MLKTLATAYGAGTLVLAAASVYLYVFPLFCSWPYPLRTPSSAGARLILVGDPQMEGDAKIARNPTFGQLDLAFNDAYFAHIHRAVHRFLTPSHEVFLGDLFSSQYISDGEHAQRVARFQSAFPPAPNVLRINVAGNHDIGYGAEVTPARVERFEAAFGAVNQIYELAGHRVVALNTIVLDGTWHHSLLHTVQETIQRAVDLTRADPKPVILITHIPLHKPMGVCAGDAPHLSRDASGSILSQNMLSPETSMDLLRRLRPVWAWSGHDHVGCVTDHRLVLQGDAAEDEQREMELDDPVMLVSGPVGADYLDVDLNGRVVAHTKEITARSIMGDYAGGVTLFQILPTQAGEYEYVVTECPFVHHIVVWVVLVADIVWALVTFNALVLLLLVWRVQRNDAATKTRPKTD